MRIFNKEKTEELKVYDLNLGYLDQDKLFITHHETVKGKAAVGHYEVLREYPNGGKEVKWVVDIPEVKAKEAYDEYEDILVYIPYTQEQLINERYPELVDEYLRERYSLSAEFAILRQRDVKIDEFNAYNNYAEECKLKAKTILGLQKIENN